MTTLTDQKVTGPEPAAGAVHTPAALDLSLPELCVRPPQYICVRAFVLAAKEPAMALETELKLEPKKAPSWKPRNEPLDCWIATRYAVPGV